MRRLDQDTSQLIQDVISEWQLWCAICFTMGIALTLLVELFLVLYLRR